MRPTNVYIDTHVHFWEPARGDYGWLKPENPLLYQDYLPDRLLPELQTHGVEALVAVQAAPTAAEAAYLLELTQSGPVPAAVSGGLDPLAERFAAELHALQAHPRFTGVRLYGAAFRADRSAEERRRLRDALDRLAAAGLTADLLVRPDELAGVAAALEDVPALPAVVNHLGCPAIREQRMDPWAAGMERLAQLQGTAVKLSGMITAAGGPHRERLQPYVDRLFQLFGCDRLLFGSDWPIALQAGGYGEVVALFEALLPAGLTEAEKDRIRAENARRIYRFGL